MEYLQSQEDLNDVWGQVYLQQLAANQNKVNMCSHTKDKRIETKQELDWWELTLRSALVMWMSWEKDRATNTKILTNTRDRVGLDLNTASIVSASHALQLTTNCSQWLSASLTWFSTCFKQEWAKKRGPTGPVPIKPKTSVLNFSSGRFGFIN